MQEVKIEKTDFYPLDGWMDGRRATLRLQRRMAVPTVFIQFWHGPRGKNSPFD